MGGRAGVWADEELVEDGARGVVKLSEVRVRRTRGSTVRCGMGWRTAWYTRQDMMQYACDPCASKMRKIE